MAALPLTTKISQSSQMTRKYRALVATFGDGYTQRAQDGIQTSRDEWSVVWEFLTEAEKDTVVTALDLAGSWDTHTWTAPGDGSAKEWRAKDGYSLSTQGGDIYTISVNLIQEYD